MKKISLIIFISSSTFCFCQEDLDKYFDDGGISKRTNIISTNLFAMINGDFGLSYHRLFKETLELELSAGKTTNKYLLDLFDYNTPNIVNSKGGISYAIQLKHLREYSIGYYLYSGIKYRYRDYNHDLFGKSTYQDFLLTGGYQYIFTKPIFLDLSTAIGLQKRRNHPYYKYALAYQIDFKLGYKF
jgi:hypothetical protein